MPRFGGSDIAHYQNEQGIRAGVPSPGIDYDALARASVDDWFACKATQRNNYVDPFFSTNRSEMGKRVRYRGLYHWQSPESEASPSSQLALWNRTVPTISIGEYDMLDSEQSTNGGVTESGALYLLEGREERSERPSGVYCGIYTAGGVMFRSARIRFSKYGDRIIHLAAYDKTDAQLAALLAAKGLSGFPYHLWQFLSDGMAGCGMVGRFDMNQAYDFAALDLCCGYQTTKEEDEEVLKAENIFKNANEVAVPGVGGPYPPGVVKMTITNGRFRRLTGTEIELSGIALTPNLGKDVTNDQINELGWYTDSSPAPPTSSPSIPTNITLDIGSVPGTATGRLIP